MFFDADIKFSISDWMNKNLLLSKALHFPDLISVTNKRPTLKLRFGG